MAPPTSETARPRQELVPLASLKPGGGTLGSAFGGSRFAVSLPSAAGAKNARDRAVARPACFVIRGTCHPLQKAPLFSLPRRGRPAPRTTSPDPPDRTLGITPGCRNAAWWQEKPPREPPRQGGGRPGSSGRFLCDGPEGASIGVGGREECSGKLAASWGPWVCGLGRVDPGAAWPLGGLRLFAARAGAGWGGGETVG